MQTGVKGRFGWKSLTHGQFVGIIGHTGSGKSTLIQHLNGLIKATDGKFYFNGEDVYADGYSMRNLRSEVGLVFQYPEHQLFEGRLNGRLFWTEKSGASKGRVRETCKRGFGSGGISGKILWAVAF